MEIENPTIRAGAETILIVEDEPAILRVLERAFLAEGYAVVVAEDGKKGLDIALRVRPQLIILDIVMPNMDGISMLKEIRTKGGDWGKNVKAIVYTNLSYQEARDEALALGIMDFIIKANVGIEGVLAAARQELS